jgi:internalin A
MMKRGEVVGSVLCILLSAQVLGCEEKKQEPVPSQPDAPAASTNAPAPPPKPEVKEEAPKPKKTLADCESGTVVSVDNPDVEAAIRLKAQKPEGDLTTADLAKLRSLNLSRVELDELDICLFRHMKNLRELFLGPGGIDDLSSIENSIQIESLRASMNPIVDLGPLSKMTKMDRLDLGNTKVEDLSALSNMLQMTELMLDGSPVADLAPLQDLTKLERLSLKRTQVKDLSPLANHKKLEFLYIGESPLADDISATGIVAKNGTKVIDD